MKRIMIIGSCGAGKSTLSRKIHELLGQNELIHLDQYYWKENWTESEKIEWEATVKRLAAKETWIIDGNYGGTMDIRLQRADTVIFLNYSTLLCLYRVLQRTWKNLGKVRADMPAGCKERFDLKFLHYVATFKMIRERNLLNKLNKLGDEKQVFIFNNDQETQNFIHKLAEA